MQADAGRDRMADLGRDLFVEPIQRECRSRARPAGVAATQFLPALLSEHGQQPIAEELVDPAVVLVDRGTRGGKELVQDEHDVVGQPVACDPVDVPDPQIEQAQRLVHAGIIRARGRRRAAAASSERRTSRVTLNEPRGRIWQARRALSGALTRASVKRSAKPGGGKVAAPSSMRTRQVPHRARPPHAEAWAMPLARLISSSVGPIALWTFGPPA